MSKTEKSGRLLPSRLPRKSGRRGIGPREEPEVIKPPKEPKQKRLPGMEDAEIQELEALAEEYDDIKNQRVALSAKEVPLKKKLLDIMKANNKTKYTRDGVEVELVVEEETVKVKIKKEKKAAAAAV